MSVPGSGTVALTQVCSALGAPTGTSLTQFKKGSQYVANNISANANVASATATMTTLRGAQSIIFGIPITSGLVGAYLGESFSNNKWYDVSGSGNNSVSVNGTVTVNTSGLNGQTYLSGNTSTTLAFPSAILPSTYTLFHVTRYANLTNRSRIITTSTTNWLSGHWGSYSGVAYHNGWVTGYTQDWSAVVTSGVQNTNGQTWLLSTDQNSLYRANGITIGTGTGGSTGSLGVNTFGEQSDWMCACILVYNFKLSAAQYQQVESWINYKYGPTLFRGLTFIAYTGYMNDDPAFFATATKTGIYGITKNGTNLTTITNSGYIAQGGATSISFQLLGLFVPVYTGNYYFYINSDDCSYCWVGANAVTGYTTGNYTTAQPGAHGVTSWTASAAISMTQGQYYPVRVQMGQSFGGLDLQFSFSGPNISQTSYIYGYFLPGGVQFSLYSGYMSDTPTYFDSLSPTSGGYTIDGTNLNTITAGYWVVNSPQNVSLQILGYFLPQTTGSHSFWLASDDCSYLWVGLYASAGYTTTNANINNGGGHAVQTVSCTVTLTAGILYPIRVQWGQGGGGCDLQFSYSTPTLGQRYDLSGYFYNSGAYLYTMTFPFTFTNMNASGYAGPTSISYGTNTPGYGTSYAMTLTSGIQYWIVPMTRLYTFTVAGAGATNNSSFNSIKTGYGVVMTATLSLSAGQIIAILVGQQGISTSPPAGGSGGTYICSVSTAGSLSTAMPLLIAGGAGGAGYEANANTNANINGTLSTTAKDGQFGAPVSAGSGGIGPNGGTVPTNTTFAWSDSGAGFSGNGAWSGRSGNSTGIAYSFTSGGTGGINNSYGGFGGGGAGGGYSVFGSGGGGGGYGGGGSGGANSQGSGGGGGSSFDSTGIYSGSATNSGMGYVTIS